MGHYGECRCGDTHARADAPRFSRRVAILGALGAPLASSIARAQELLDPTSLSAARLSSPSDPPARARSANRIDPSYARGMAASVTSALLSLVRAYGAIADQIGKLDARNKDLTGKLDEAVRNKQLQLDEYRQGLFCSGCNRTKSDILSKGEQFPHAGQTIIKPTPEQIAAKERELQAVIDRLAAELNDVRDKRAKLDPDINSIKDQIFEGMGLWRTAVAFHARLLRQEDLDDEDAYVRERRRITTQLDMIPKEAFAATRSVAVQRGIDDLKGWVSTLAQVEQRRGGERARYGDSLTRADTTARQEVTTVQNEANAVAAGITAFGYSGYLAILTTIMSPAIQPNLPGEASGYMFRMGKYDRASAGQILPNVAEFVAKSKNTLPVFAGGTAPAAFQEIGVAEANVARLQSRLRAVAAQEQLEREVAEAKRLELQAQQAASPPGTK